MAIKATAAALVLVVLQFALHAAAAHHGLDRLQHGGRPQRFYAPSPPVAHAAAYRFEYGVKDAHAHDLHGRYEESDGRGNVKGSYSLVEPDGSTRVVKYSADGGRGFNAVITKTGAPRHLGGGHLATVATSFSSSSSSSSSSFSAAAAAAAAAGYHGPEFLQHSSRPSSYYKFYWLPSRNHQ